MYVNGMLRILVKVIKMAPASMASELGLIFEIVGRKDGVGKHDFTWSIRKVDIVTLQ